MTARPDDPLFRQLERLASAAPDATHSAAVRARCHAALARRRCPRAQSDEAKAPRRYLALVGAGTFAMAYVVVVIHDALAMYGLFQSAP